MIRRAAFAYDWYPGEPNTLRSTIKRYVGDRAPSEEAMAVVSPHAGYQYSGHVAGAVYGRVKAPDTAVVLCVNHRGIGARAAIMSSGAWETPLGKTPIQEEMALSLLESSPLLDEDTTAHAREHSLELQLPFLQYINPKIRLVPIALQHLSYEECEQLGASLARSVKSFKERVLLVASNDMTHFESQQMAAKKDRLAIDRILAIDPNGLYSVVHQERISMCGVIPTTVVLCACRGLGATRGALVTYATSGDITKEYSSVVGYAGITIQ